MPAFLKRQDLDARLNDECDGLTDIRPGQFVVYLGEPGRFVGWHSVSGRPVVLWGEDTSNANFKRAVARFRAAHGG